MTGLVSLEKACDMLGLKKRHALRVLSGVRRKGFPGGKRIKFFYLAEDVARVAASRRSEAVPVRVGR